MALDQICAPIRALSNYVQLTGDDSILFDRRVQAGINNIQQILAAQRHPEAALLRLCCCRQAMSKTAVCLFLQRAGMENSAGHQGAL